MMTGWMNEGQVNDGWMMNKWLWFNEGDNHTKTVSIPYQNWNTNDWFPAIYK